MFSPLCQLNGGCMGCCGHDFISKEKVKEAIHKNTTEFIQIKEVDEDSLVKFRDRAYASDLRHGVCRNLIEEKGRFLCPLHPARNHGKDLRIGHCNVNYFCKTAQKFALWNTGKQASFISFIEKKKLDNVAYSIMMDNGNLLQEFEKTYNMGKVLVTK